jgi:hypothetical protein
VLRASFAGAGAAVAVAALGVVFVRVGFVHEVFARAGLVRVVTVHEVFD